LGGRHRYPRRANPLTDQDGLEGRYQLFRLAEAARAEVAAGQAAFGRLQDVDASAP
jgi:hypothetical protein